MFLQHKNVVYGFVMDKGKAKYVILKFKNYTVDTSLMSKYCAIFIVFQNILRIMLYVIIIEYFFEVQCI